MSGTRLLQIYESDLADLEHTLPDLLDASYRHLTARQKVQWRRVIQILTNVRWNYGPPSAVGTVPADDSGETPGADGQGVE